MTRIVSKFGIAAALTLGIFSTAAAQGRRRTAPTTPVTVTKGEVVVRVDTVRMMMHDTVMKFMRDTIMMAGPTMNHFDTVTVMQVPGWLDSGNGLYFGAGAGPYYPSGGLGVGQIPGYAFQMNLGVDPAGSPLGFRVAAQLARPDESQTWSAGRGRPSIMNLSGDVKLRLPFFRGTRFPNFGLYGVAGGALVRAQDVAYDIEPNHTSAEIQKGSKTSFGYSLGAGLTLNLGHRRQLFLEPRLINYTADKSAVAGRKLEKAHQLPIILGVNWYK